MKRYLWSLVLVWALCACSEESKVKEAAVIGAQEQFQNEAREEIAKGVTGKPHAQAIAVRVLKDKSDFEVQKVNIQGDRAEVLVQVLTVPAKARTALIEIMQKLDEKKEDRFNVPDALKLILQQMELTETRGLLIYKVKLEKSEGWRVIPEKK